MNNALNNALISNQGALRAEVAAWAVGQSALDAAWARSDFEEAVLCAAKGDDGWVENTNSSLAAALGGCTIVSRVLQGLC